MIAALVRVQPKDSVTVLVPPHTDAAVSGTRTIKVGFSKGVIWEQLALPLFARRDRIVNLGNSGSIFLGKQIIYMHDAAVFDTPAHFSQLFRAWYRIMFWILARTSICVLTNSRFSRDRLAHHCGVSTKKISVVPLGADHLDALEPDTTVLKELSLTPGRFVLAVSSMNPTKNFGRLIAAFRQINDPSVDLVVSGQPTRLDERV
ncbi:glycosyltransferase involved in cell wall biosynthesis [Burkholderia ambifaria]|nr:glycosyltransferase involved in cell wall biosynthesis [Burkholderia ambifaria]